MTVGLNCAACGGPSTVKFHALDVNRQTSVSTFGYRTCLDCGLIFLTNPPADLAACYPEDYFIGSGSPRRDGRQVANANEQLDLLRRFVSSGRLIEIGPGMGHFASAAKRNGFEVVTVEQDSGACDHLARVIGVRAVNTERPEDVLAVSPGDFDAVAMWHSLEHIPTAWKTLAAAMKSLREGGVLVIATPNPDAWQFQVMGRRWPHLDAPRHFWLMPLSALTTYLAPLGGRLVWSTSNDRDGYKWNLFGWSQFLLNYTPATMKRTLPARIIARVLGLVIEAVTRPWERQPLRGSAYTAVFQRTTSAD